MDRPVRILCALLEGLEIHAAAAADTAAHLGGGGSAHAVGGTRHHSGRQHQGGCLTWTIMLGASLAFSRLCEEQLLLTHARR